jgi:alpha-amylase
MFADMDYSQPDVRADVLNWGEWLGKEVKLSGMRLDAVKHYSEDFLRTFIRHLDDTVGKDWFFVAEYWTAEFAILAPYITRMNCRMSLFDVQLLYNLSYASKARRIDLRRIFDGTLAKHLPKNAVVRDIKRPANMALTSDADVCAESRHPRMPITRGAR